MGLARAGFRSRRMVEWDRHAVANVEHNRERGIRYVADWPIHLGDVRGEDWTEYAGTDLVAGGPPCQPFSIGGRHLGHDDRRDMWPEAVRAVREIEPMAFLFENVRGLARTAFADYLHWVIAALSHPHIAPLDGETRVEHLMRIERSGPALYRVQMHRVNAADFGAAQKRHRVIFIGAHRGAGAAAPVLTPTHTRERLLWDQWITGEYWARHDIAPPAGGPDKADEALVRRLRESGDTPPSLPWRTLRDAIEGLGDPGSGSYSNHIAQSGARSYPGHTGSALDMPAKALKAGVHGVPGGENTIALADGDIRYLTVREAARLQGMPDDFEFIGSWSENMRQLGNAVPTQLAWAAATAGSRAISHTVSRKAAEKRAA
jgi:DNA (cytosine-5)-methyltransferase 1